MACALSVVSAIFLHIINRQQRLLEAQAVTDPLTGVYNRVLLHDFVDEAVRRNRRSGRPMALAMMDLDHFKGVNDTLGHDAGDAVLRGVGALLRGRARRTDRVFRLGGEEFLVLLHDTGAEGARRLAEDLRTAVAPPRCWTATRSPPALAWRCCAPATTPTRGSSAATRRCTWPSTTAATAWPADPRAPSSPAAPGGAKPGRSRRIGRRPRRGGGGAQLTIPPHADTEVNGLKLLGTNNVRWPRPTAEHLFRERIPRRPATSFFSRFPPGTMTMKRMLAPLALFATLTAAGPAAPAAGFTPDLIIVGVSSPHLDQGVVVAQVKNQGQVTAGASHLVVSLIEYNKSFSAAVGAIPAGATVNVSVPTGRLLSQISFNVFADRSNEVIETSETNNRYFGRFGGKP